MGRQIGPRATALMHHFEGCSLESYLCPAGKWTIGWGNTFYEDGRKVRPGERISQARADELFRLIVAKFERGVDARVDMAVGQTSPGQFGAMVSLAYNIGLGNFAKSSVLRHHRAGRFAQAADAFLMWRMAKGRPSAGLLRRRRAERLLYLGKLAEFDKAIGYRP